MSSAKFFLLLLSSARMGGTAAYDKFYFEITYLSVLSPINTLPSLSLSFKLVDVATGVNVATDEERINDSLVEKLKFGQDIKAEFFVTFFS